MASLSVRFKDPEVHRRMQRRAAGSSMSALAERLIDEGLRMDNARIEANDREAQEGLAAQERERRLLTG